MSDFPHHPQRYTAEPSTESWIVAIATALLVLFLAGVLPRILL